MGNFKKFIIYLLRWIFSGLVMLLPLYLLNLGDMTNPYVNLIIVQIIGAFLFWHIDNSIFKNKGITKIKERYVYYKKQDLKDIYKNGVLDGLSFSISCLENKS